MKREEYNLITNYNLINTMGKNTTSRNTENAVNPCGCTHTHTHTHTFSLNDFKIIDNLQIGSQYYSEPYLVAAK